MSSWHKLGSEVARDSELLLSSERTFKIVLHDFSACCRALVTGVEPVIDRLVLVHADRVPQIGLALRLNSPLPIFDELRFKLELLLDVLAAQEFRFRLL